MTQDDLAKLVERHNHEQQVWAGVYVGAAVLLWPLSYWVLRVIVVAVVMLATGDEPTWYMTDGLTCLLTLGLVAEAYRRHAALNDMEDPLAAAAPDPPPEHADRWLAEALADRDGYRPSWQVAWDVACAAPYATTAAARSLRSRLYPDARLLASAHELVNRLADATDWTDAVAHADHARGMLLLDRLGLIWKRDHGDRPAVKVSPDAFSELFGSRPRTPPPPA